MGGPEIDPTFFLECTGKLHPGGLPRNSVVRITDRPVMNSAVYRGRKALDKIKQNFAFARVPYIIK